MGHVNEPIVNLPVVGNARNTRQKGLLTYLQHISLHTLRYCPIAIAIYHAPRLIPAGPFQLPIAIPIPLPNPFRHKNCEVINIALFSDGRKEKERQSQGEREREKIEGDQREEERREEIREHAPEGQDHLRTKLDSCSDAKRLSKPMWIAYRRISIN